MSNDIAFNCIYYVLFCTDALDDINFDELERLEDTLEEANRVMDDAQLQVRYEVLLLQQTQQKQYLFTFSQELGDLQAAVENIQQINDTIPRTCFNVPVLEPTIKPIAG